MLGTNQDQFGRKWQLLFSNGEVVIDLSELHLRFEVRQSDVQTPNTCFVRVYNLSDSTLRQVYGLAAKDLNNAAGPEYSQVTLQAGYENGNYGVVFSGTVKQLRNGKETNVDTFLDILASDIDLPYNFAVLNQTLAPGVTPAQQLEAIARGQNAVGADPIALGELANLTGGVLPRGKVLYGMSKDEWWNIGTTTGTTIFVDNGTLQALPLTGYLPSEAVVLTSATGVVGVPELTQNGLEVTCLLNPKIRVGTRIQLDNASITSTAVLNRGAAGAGILNDLAFFANTSADGTYRVAAVDYEGDTRGEPWYSRITALSVDLSTAPSNSVKKFG